MADDQTPESVRPYLADWVVRSAAEDLVSANAAEMPTFSARTVLRLLDRLAAVEKFAAENEAWESRVPIGPGNASYINGFENGRHAAGADLRDLLKSPGLSPDGDQ